MFQDNKFPPDLPPQITKTDTPNITRLIKLLLPPPCNMVTAIILLQVAMLCLHSNFALASTLNQLPDESKHAIPTTEFTPTQFHIQTDDGENRFFKYQT